MRVSTLISRRKYKLDLSVHMRRANCNHEHIVGICVDCGQHLEPRRGIEGDKAWRDYSDHMLQASREWWEQYNDNMIYNNDNTV